MLAVALTATLVWLASATFTGDPCADGTGWVCNSHNTGTSIEIGATYEEPGTGGRDHSPGGHWPDSDASTSPDAGAGPGADGCIDILCRPSFVVEMLPTATLSDVASFAPVLTPVAGEPGGFGIVGMPVNFVAEAATHSATGELFSLPVTVRFTPVAFVFEHGDGTSRTSTTGGATWAALGLPQFSATPTSHAYAARGVYAARVAVRYSAAVDFGTGWRDVAGLLELAGPTSTITVLEARTALVQHTCTERPTGPAC